jgi:hypothetical protein
LGGFVDGADPDDVYAEVFEVVQLGCDAGNVSPSIAICVQERSWIDL